MSSANKTKMLLRCTTKTKLVRRSITNSKSLEHATLALSNVQMDSNSSDNKTLLDLDGPKGWPVLGNFPTYMKKKNIGRMHEVQAELHNTYGSMFKEKWGPNQQLHVNDPDAIEAIMRSEQKYPDRPPVQSWRLYRKITGLPSGLVTAEKDEWLRIRKTLSKRILQPRQVSYYTKALNNVTDDLIQHIRRVRDNAGEDVLAKSLPNEMYKWSMECIGNIVFDTRMGCLEERMPERVQEFINAINTMMSSSIPLLVGETFHYKINSSFWKKHKAAWDRVFEIGGMYIDEKLEEIKRREESHLSLSTSNSEPERTDLLTFMLANKNLSRADVYVNVAEILLSGIDTTSNSLCFSLYLLSKHPEVQERLAKEVQRVVGSKTPSYDDFEHMPYLRAVLKESLRMFPVITMNVRVLEDNLSIKGYHIPKGTMCVMNNYAACRNENHFDRANEFHPERWLREESNKTNNGLKHHPFASLPFGYGTRSCIGKRIAHLELQLALTKISQQFWVAPHSGEMKPFLRTLLTPGNTVPVQFVDR